MVGIPTAAKERLPKGFSYPLGAQAISDALDSVPGLEDARLWFSWRDEYWASEWRQKIAALGEVILLEVADSCLGPGRDVRVYAVPSEYSMAARARLISELPRVRRVLTDGGASGELLRVRITFDLGAAVKNEPRCGWGPMGRGDPG
jgi:hypothetical protein